jgi:hypothetical protein
MVCSHCTVCFEGQQQTFLKGMQWVLMMNLDSNFLWGKPVEQMLSLTLDKKSQVGKLLSFLRHSKSLQDT